MSGTLKELSTELETIKDSLLATAAEGSESVLLEDLLSKVQNASRIVQELGKKRHDYALQKDLKGSLLDIREAMKNPELSSIIKTNLLDNLRKFFQPPPSIFVINEIGNNLPVANKMQNHSKRNRS